MLVLAILAQSAALRSGSSTRFLLLILLLIAIILLIVGMVGAIITWRNMRKM